MRVTEVGRRGGEEERAETADEFCRRKIWVDYLLFTSSVARCTLTGSKGGLRDDDDEDAHTMTITLMWMIMLMKLGFICID